MAKKNWMKGAYKKSAEAAPPKTDRQSKMAFIGAGKDIPGKSKPKPRTERRYG